MKVFASQIITNRGAVALLRTLLAVEEQKLAAVVPAKSSSAQSSSGYDWVLTTLWQLPPKQLGRVTEPDPQTQMQTQSLSYSFSPEDPSVFRAIPEARTTSHSYTAHYQSHMMNRHSGQTLRRPRAVLRYFVLKGPLKID